MSGQIELVILSWDDPNYVHVVGVEPDDGAGNTRLERAERGVNTHLGEGYFTEIRPHRERTRNTP